LEEQKIYHFRRLALFSTLVTYLLIFVGGLVRVSGAGLGCPDWPKCFGRWIPPISKNQIPAGFSPDTFNLTLAWIEYINRLLGVLVGLLILATAIMALIHFRKQLKILIPSLLAAFLVALQGWYGSVVVASKLHPLTVSIHLVLALTIVSLLVYITQTVGYLNYSGEKHPFPLKKWLVALWLLAIIQIVLGTQVRTAIENIQSSYPLMLDHTVMQNIGMINYIHSIGGILLTAITVIIGLKIFSGVSGGPRALISIVIMILLAQIIVGSAMQLFAIPQILQVFHLWLAGLFIGLILIIYVDLKYKAGDKNV
jgi:cytochrome c oxidase assembly protein subunit 15